MKNNINKYNQNNLTDSLRKNIAGERVSVFIDAANLYHSAAVVNSKNNNRSLKIDFIQIYNWFKTNSKEVTLKFYTAFDPDNDKQIEFLNQLDAVG